MIGFVIYMLCLFAIIGNPEEYATKESDPITVQPPTNEPK